MLLNTLQGKGGPPRPTPKNNLVPKVSSSQSETLFPDSGCSLPTGAQPDGGPALHQRHFESPPDAQLRATWGGLVFRPLSLFPL